MHHIDSFMAFLIFGLGFALALGLSVWLFLRSKRVPAPDGVAPRRGPPARRRVVCPGTPSPAEHEVPTPHGRRPDPDLAPSSTEPGELPATMAAWVIREERQGEPVDAFQVEEIEVPEPGAFEVIVRVMAAGVNYNNVWAALGEPVSVLGYGDHPEYGHHIGGSDASGIVWKVGEGVTRWKPGDEVVIHCNQASYEDPEVHGLDPMAAPSQRIWGYETTWGSFAQFTKVQAQQLLPKPQEPDLGGGRLLRPRLLHRLPHADDRAQPPGRRPRPDLGRRRRARRVRHASSARRPAPSASASSPRRRRASSSSELGARGLHQPQRVQGHDAHAAARRPRRRRRASRSRARFAKRVKEILGDAPDIVFEHVGKATFPTSVFTVKPFGKVVICAGTTGYNLDFDVRYLWMRQKEIIGSHFANAYECNKANELIETGQIRPVLWRTMAFDGVAEAHQLMRDNKHSGKIAILVGAEEEGQGKTGRRPRRDPRGGGSLMAGSEFHIPWYATGFRGDELRAPRWRRSPRSRCATARRATRLPLQRRPLQVPADRALRGQDGLRALLGRAAR